MNWPIWAQYMYDKLLESIVTLVKTCFVILTRLRSWFTNILSVFINIILFPVALDISLTNTEAAQFSLMTQCRSWLHWSRVEIIFWSSWLLAINWETTHNIHFIASHFSSVSSILADLLVIWWSCTYLQNYFRYSFPINIYHFVKPKSHNMFNGDL